jgi:hypothetical protein
MNRPDSQNILAESTYILVLCHFFEGCCSQDDADEENCGKKLMVGNGAAFVCRIGANISIKKRNAQSVVLSTLGQ